MLAAGALIASILAVGAGPTAAQPASTITAATPNHNPDAGAEWSACVGAAGTYDAMFPDVGEDNAHAAAINCIAYYGVTAGKLDGTYAPGEHVTAFQMGHFVRAAADLMGADADAVLGNVMLSDTVTRLEMAQLMFGLVNDVNDDIRISPADGQIQFYDDDTNAWVVVDDFFADAKAQVPIADSQIVGAIYELGITRGTRGDGTLVSTAGSTFEPFAPVTRAQMATFITATLDHSNLRPEGLSIQRNGLGNTMVSYRDGDFAAIEDARIDVFSALYPDDAFDADDGECEARFVQDETPSHSTCAIDIGDQLTDDEGNVEFTLVSDDDLIQVTCGTSNFRFESAAGSAGRTFWAWTGDLSDEVDEDADLQQLEDVARPVGAAGPDYARVSGGLPTGDEIAKMGESVTFTLQLYSDVRGRDDVSLINDVAAGPDRSGNPYHLKVEKYFVDSNGTSDSDAETTAGTANTDFAEVPGDWDYISLATANTASPTATSTTAEALFQTPMDTVVFPNSDGQYPITLSHSDLNAASDNTDVAVKFTLTPFLQANDLISANLLTDIVVNSRTHDASVQPLTGFDRVQGYVIFSDDASDPHNVTGESAGYRIIAGSRTGNSVTVSVVDQYGDGMRNVQISVESGLDADSPTGGTPDPDQATYPEEVDDTVQPTEDGDGDGTPGGAEDDVTGTFRTRRNGAYRIGYTYTGTDAQTETIIPESVQVTGDNPATPDATETNFELIAQELGDGVPVYWTKVGSLVTSTFGGNLLAASHLVGDVANRTIVVHERDHANDTTTDEPAAYFYDEDDTFIIENVGATFEMFEEALSLSTVAGDPCQVETVMWENYVIARPGRVNRTIWEITLS